MTTERRRSRDRRSTSAARPRSYSKLYRNDATAPLTTLVGATVPAPQENTAVNWSQEYGYVVQDLRRLLIVSGSLFLLIILAGFFF